MWAFKSLSDQLDPFWLSRDMLSDVATPDNKGFWLQNGSPETPIKYGGMPPSQEPFWLL